MKTGTFYGVSVGPGDPGLMTLRAAQVIRDCPVLAVPISGGETMVALEIACKAVPEANEKELLRLSFPMIHDREELRRCHDRAAAQVMEVLDGGRDVAMLNLGDASIYATYSQVQSRVLAAGRHEVVTIPGVPSFCAVAARLNTGLTRPHLPLHIIPAGYPGLEEAMGLPGTKVLMKAGKDGEKVRELLRRSPRGASAQMIVDCGRDTERIYRSLDEVRGETGYFSTIVVKEEG